MEYAQVVAIALGDGAKLDYEAIAADIVKPLPTGFVDDDIDVFEVIDSGVGLPLVDNFGCEALAGSVAGGDLVANPGKAGAAKLGGR